MENGSTKLDDAFNALANKCRRSIVFRLSLQPSSISKLAKEQKLSLPAIHKHIKILEEAKLLKRKKSGRCNFLALDRAGLISIQKWIEQYHTHWGNDKETLENYIEGIERGNVNS